jgi:hypothetical protein
MRLLTPPTTFQVGFVLCAAVNLYYLVEWRRKTAATQTKSSSGMSTCSSPSLALTFPLAAASVYGIVTIYLDNKYSYHNDPSYTQTEHHLWSLFSLISLLTAEDLLIYWISRLATQLGIMNRIPDDLHYSLFSVFFPRQTFASVIIPFVSVALPLSYCCSQSSFSFSLFMIIRAIETGQVHLEGTSFFVDVNTLICEHIFPLHRNPTVIACAVYSYSVITSRLQLPLLCLGCFLFFSTILDSNRLPNAKFAFPFTLLLLAVNASGVGLKHVVKLLRLP